MFLCIVGGLGGGDFCRLFVVFLVCFGCFFPKCPSVFLFFDAAKQAPYMGESLSTGELPNTLIRPVSSIKRSR